MSFVWQPNKVDLIIATTIAFGYPFLANLLYRFTGALLPMLIYYSLAWGLSIFRRGSSGYEDPRGKNVPRAFYINVAIVLLALIFGYQASIVATNSTVVGIVLTAIIWSVINASSEQLLWLYLFDSWDLYPKSSKSGYKFLYRIIGLLMFSAYVGLIHTMFWVLFLHTTDPSIAGATIFVILTSVTGYVHIIVWRKSHNMLYTFIPHFLLNFLPFFWTHYSMLPYLLTF